MQNTHFVFYIESAVISELVATAKKQTTELFAILNIISIVNSKKMKNKASLLAIFQLFFTLISFSKELIYLNKIEAEQIVQNIPNFNQIKVVLANIRIRHENDYTVGRINTVGLALMKDNKNKISNSEVIGKLYSGQFEYSFSDFNELKNKKLIFKNIENKTDLALVFYCLKNRLVTNSSFPKDIPTYNVSELIYDKQNKVIMMFSEIPIKIGLYEFNYMKELGVEKEFIKKIFDLHKRDKICLEGHSNIQDNWLIQNYDAVKVLTSFANYFGDDNECRAFLNSKYTKDLIRHDQLIEITSKFPQIFEAVPPRYFEMNRLNKEKILQDFLLSKNLNFNNLSKNQDLIDLFLNVGVYHDDASLSKTIEKYKSKGNKYDTYSYNEYAYNIEGLVVNMEDYLLHFGFYDDSNFDTNKILLRLSCTFKNKQEFEKFKIIFQHFDLSDYKAGNTRFFKNSNRFVEQRNGKDFINMWGHPPYDGLLEISENNSLISLYNYRGNSTPAFSLNKNKFSSVTIKELNQFEYEKLEKTYNRNVNFLSSFNTPFEVSRSSSSSSNSSDYSISKDNDTQSRFNSFKESFELKFVENIKNSNSLLSILPGNSYDGKCPCNKYKLKVGSYFFGRSYDLYEDSDGKWWFFDLFKDDGPFKNYEELQRFLFVKRR
ncbi:hypothetical protein [Spirosoma fluviale]|uniref:Uncharacterized protein n=1 Tax=Spirosoma fluviale TaxID=1597977 RepID=A0A286GKY3_9BACT|nr:hypothetical protein [Spirosoma fluviale]SOD95846.1 hypothetical protein SAMN06269250_5011 [Spirosoma fluviale]